MNSMRNAIVFALVLAAGAAFAAPQTRVSYDAHSFKIDGKNTFIYSGAFHYFRCPEELWPERFRAIKNAGFNTIETYAAWNVHEPRPPRDVNDFSKVDVKELDDFLTMAIEKYGFNVVVRPGPYICSEWDMGGYPAWLMTKKPAHPTEKPWLRSDDPTYLDWARHWYKAVDPVIAKHQITRAKPGGKGVILYQIENEYDYASGSDQEHLNQLHALAEQAIADGIDVPLISCWTHQIRTTTDPILKSVVDCPNFYPRWDVDGTKGSILAAHDQQPGKPVMITELQGGWFSEVGGLLAEDQSGITAAQERNLTLFCIQNGVTATNYYMLFGGTNFGDRTPPNITTSYDYFAPIREDGSGGPKYQEVKAIGEFLAKYGSEVATSSPDPVSVTTDHPEVQLAVRTAENGTRFVFLRNSSHLSGFKGTALVGADSFNYALDPFGSYVIVVPPGGDLQHGEWLPKTGESRRDRPMPEGSAITEAWVRPDDGERSGKPAILGDVALNGVYDNRYVVYRAKLGDVQLDTKLWLALSGSGSGVVRIDGKTLDQSGKRHGQPLFDLPANSSGSTVEVLYENPGRPNGGDGMEEDHGLVASKLIVNGQSDRSFSAWKIRNATLEGAQALVAPDVDDSTWESIELRAGDRQDQLNGYGTVAVFRTGFDLDQKSLDAGLTHLDFGGIDDEGWVYVNGTKVGENHQWDVPVEADVKPYLHAGKNTIAVIVRNFGGQGGLYEIPLLTGGKDEGASLDWRISELNGVQQHWERATSTDGWQKVEFTEGLTRSSESQGSPQGNFRTVTVPRLIAIIPARKIVSGTAKAGRSDTPSTSLTTWYRMQFQKPNSKRTLALRIDALGNGLMWLNGHPLGRFWQVGPEREYFLPACWVKDGENDLTLQLRPVDGYAAVRAAEVTSWGK
jgi:hypothetical protein